MMVKTYCPTCPYNVDGKCLWNEVIEKGDKQCDALVED